MERVNRDFLYKQVKDIMYFANTIEDVVSKEYNQLSTMELYGLRYCLISLIESLTNICIHIVRVEYNIKPTSFSECFKILLDKNIIDNNIYTDLRNMLKLRNLLVHRYWLVDDRVIYDNIRSDFRSIKRFVEIVKKRYGL